MDGLKRVVYKNPPIVSAAVHVALSWTYEEMIVVKDELIESAQTHFKLVEPLYQQQLRFEVNPSAPMFQPQMMDVGLRCTTTAGTIVLFEHSGIRAIHNGHYPGRDTVMEGLTWWCSKIAERFPQHKAIRIGSMIENHIVPDGEISFPIEDYFFLNFEFEDPRLNEFVAFEHKLQINPSRFGVSNLACSVIFRYPSFLPSGKPGVGLTIDVVDASEGPLTDVKERADRAKNFETHVFESTIRDKTREMYGPTPSPIHPAI